MTDDRTQAGGMPAWGWVVLLIAVAMCVGMVIKALSTGAAH
jgi:hypothetical protein